MQRQAAADVPALDSISRMIRRIPKRCLERQTPRATFYLIRDFVFIGLLTWAIVAAHSWAVGLPAALLLGTVLTGLFVIGHDAGHRSFSLSERLNDVVGHLAMAPLLWPFHVWRLSHDHHHRWTHHAEREIAWKPLTRARYDSLPPFARRVYRLTRSSLYFVASTLFQFFMVKDAVEGRFFEPRDAAKLRLSLRLTALFGVVYLAAAAWAGGVYGLVCLFLVPQLAFHFWLSTFTLFHHTSVENELLPAAEWSPERAQLTLSVHVHYPRLVDWLTHDIAAHVPHHVCVGVPHYRLREAHAALKQAYPQWVQERRLTPAFVRSVLTSCHLVGSRQSGGLGWEAATPPAPRAGLSTAKPTLG